MNQGVVTTIAGSGYGFADGPVLSAKFNMPEGVAIDSFGTIYVADTENRSIRKIAAGTVLTLAGTPCEDVCSGFADGPAADAHFYFPPGIAVDAAGTVYVADSRNDRIRKITTGGFVSTFAGSSHGFADGADTAAQFKNPYGIAVDSAGTLYVADSGNSRIRKITPDGQVSTLAGSDTAGNADGTGVDAQFTYPRGIAVDSAGTVYVADASNHRIRKVMSTGEVTTLAGSSQGFSDGDGAAAQFNSPYGIAVDAWGTIYVADAGNNRIRKITPEGVVSTLAGSTYGLVDGTGTAAKFYNPSGIAVDASGTLYVADTYNDRIRKIE